VSAQLAYHAIVRALEATGGWTPRRQFAESVRHAVQGHVPYLRCYQGGVRAAKDRMGLDTIERLVNEQLAFDLNPLTQLPRFVPDMQELIRGYNEYTGSVNLGIRWTVVASDAPQPTQSRTWVSVVSREDPYACQHARFAVLQESLRRMPLPSRGSAAPALMRLSGLAGALGVQGGAACEVSQVFESEGPVPLAELARRLACHPRTLERRLREEGLTAEILRQAVRLLHAMARMRSGGNLAAIAAEAGYADHAHMTRSFRASCGMAPSFFKRLMAAPTPVA